MGVELESFSITPHPYHPDQALAESGLLSHLFTLLSWHQTTLCCWDIVITNEDGQRTCTARITCMILADR